MRSKFVFYSRHKSSPRGQTFISSDKPILESVAPNRVPSSNLAYCVTYIVLFDVDGQRNTDTLLDFVRLERKRPAVFCC